MLNHGKKAARIASETRTVRVFFWQIPRNLRKFPVRGAGLRSLHSCSGSDSPPQFCGEFVLCPIWQARLTAVSMGAMGCCPRRKY